MIKFKAIFAFAANAVTKYKARRVHDVINNYFGVIDTQVSATLPAAIELYRSSATVIVDKTFEDSKPALQLIAAVQAVSEHYGPALRAEFEAFSAKLEANGASPAIVHKIEALANAIDALASDVNDH